MTLDQLRAESPFPWTQQVNFDSMGGCRMIDATNREVPLLSMMAICQWASTLPMPTPAAPAPGPSEQSATSV